MLRWKLHIYLLIEVLAFIAAIMLFPDHFVWSIILLLLSALFLNFSLHITVHHFLHFTPKNRIAKTTLELLYSVILVLPYNFYRLQHFNHHRHNNLIGDFTSTWKKKGDTIVSKSFFSYSFLWLFTIPTGQLSVKGLQHGDIEKSHLLKMKRELALIVIVFTMLLWLSPIACLAYTILFYLGWSFVAMTNYGQHLPISYNDTLAYTYPKKWYNTLFFNNGLHYEHHENPGLDYPKLELKFKSLIRLPHLIIPILQRKTTSSK